MAAATALVRLPPTSSASRRVPQRRPSSLQLRGNRSAGSATPLNPRELFGSLNAAPVVQRAKEVLRLQGAHTRTTDGSSRRSTAPTDGLPRAKAVTSFLRGVKTHRPGGASGGGDDGGQPEQPAEPAADEIKLPVNFDWRTELAGMVAEGQDPLGDQVDQGPCGSCYGFVGILMLQMRFRIQLFRKHGILYPLELSFKSPVRCSPYTEGCDGGFAYFTGRAAQEVGVPLASCDREVALGDLNQACDMRCYTNNSMLFYARDYWHIGGFSHGSDEGSIMREIYINGPVDLGFSTTAIPEFVKVSGHSVQKETDVMTVMHNHKTLKEEFSSRDDVHRWWASTHAIIGVGWGQDEVSWGTLKYWSVRNSWGRAWGVNGYGKIRRGNNDGGIETDATAIDPDMSRLPPGFLEQAKLYHEHREARPAGVNSRSQSQTPTTHAAPGIPQYCKDRPNSPDCNLAQTGTAASLFF
eukprot:TRINITY_DN17013_c0_g1_i1.p1 TRINITY_DN17013_c0_g1~~TRINITY_DN17013_c0_g1_i1.p1  ORF type:complete len:467 (+),score=82.63 TRINITY_DN17013_c0_g1_i1:751-2151(+)